MNNSKIHLLPTPVKIQRKSGFFQWNTTTEITIDPATRAVHLEETLKLVDAIAARLHQRPVIRCIPLHHNSANVLIITLEKVSLPTEGYTLNISREKIELSAGDAAGLFYGIQTLLQIFRQTIPQIPCFEIKDKPTFPVRGIYHDVTRGKVPTMETLFSIVEKLAHYKINHFQLYIEHTYAFRRHADVWQGSDPLTAEDILRLDEHCARHHVELVPSFSTFGHLYALLCSKRKEHLNELDIHASERPFSWHDRMAHYTINPLNPESITLIRELVQEVRPLFRTHLFNICCDETFDLGKGRNADRADKHGVGRLYVDFLKKIMGVVLETGCTPMFWGDIIGHHPELLSELPRKAIALDWDYSPELNRCNSAKLRKAKIPFIVCPGVHGWNNWINNLDTAHQNILNFARRGIVDGASGVLTTDWGDFGHVNFLGNSFHGFLLGAAAAWNPTTGENEPRPFDVAFSTLEWNDPSGKIVLILRQGSELSAPFPVWKCLEYWRRTSEDIPSDWYQKSTGIPNEVLDWNVKKLLKNFHEMEKHSRELETAIASSCPPDAILPRETLLSFRFAATLMSVALVLKHHAGQKISGFHLTAWQVADKIRHAETEICKIWHLRNRPSEYHRLRTVLLDISGRLDVLQMNNTRNKNETLRNSSRQSV